MSFSVSAKHVWIAALSLSLTASAANGASGRTWLCASVAAGIAAAVSTHTLPEVERGPLDFIVPGVQAVVHARDLQYEPTLTFWEKMERLMSGAIPGFLGSLSLGFLIRGATRSYFVIDPADFWKAVSVASPGVPKRTLVLSGFSRNDVNHVYSINRIIENHDSEYDQHFFYSSPAQLISFLKNLPQMEQFDRIEIHSHAVNGKLLDHQGNDFSQRLMEELGGLKITAPGSDLVIYACSFMAGEPFQSPDREKLVGLGRAFLNQTGRVIAASRTIATSDTMMISKEEPLPRRIPLYLLKSGAVGTVAALGVWPFLELKDLLISDPWRNYEASRQDVIVEEIK